MTSPAREIDVPLRLVVIGGGFTGTALAINAIRQTQGPLAIAIVEPAAELGRGIAYGTDDPDHRINVPSDRMGLFKAEPSEATRWLGAHACLDDPACRDDQGHFFVPRRSYGAFMSDVLQRTVDAASPRVRLRHHRTSATAVARTGTGWTVTLQDGTAIPADVTALCFGHAVPVSPCPITPEARQHAKFVPDPWAKQALAGIASPDAVLIVGTGLTMADVLVSLVAKGHAGPITAISRRGLLPRSHGLFLSDIDIFEHAAVPSTALGLLRLLRRRIRNDGPAYGWHPIVDALRAKLPLAWGALPPAEKRKVLRRLLPFWEVHRFRIAPQVSAALANAIHKGQLAVERAGLAHLDRVDGGFVARLQRPGSGVEPRVFDAVVLCTGPDKNLRTNPLMADLLESGTARLDEMGLGLAVDQASHVLGRDGQPWPTLLAFGPITRGTFGEMTGAPDIAAHIERVAASFFATAGTGGAKGI